MIVIPFLSFKRIIQAYLVKISITHNKRRISLLNLPIDYISVRSAPQVLLLNNEYTFIFSIFLMIDLGNSSANCSFCLVSFCLIAPPADFFFYQNVYKPKKQDLFDIHHILDF